MVEYVDARREDVCATVRNEFGCFWTVASRTATTVHVEIFLFQSGGK